jgi:hypothetical protein
MRVSRASKIELPLEVRIGGVVSYLEIKSTYPLFQLKRRRLALVILIAPY